MDRKKVNVEIHGKSCRVPEGVNLLQAYWEIGEEIFHGVGCLGGVCGACTVTYRTGNPPQTLTGLACQIPVQEGMSFSLFPVETPRIRPYRLDAIEHPRENLLKIFPETKRCIRCRACTLACPQGIPVMDGVLQALQGDFENVSDSFYNCVMCGLCAAVCEVQIAPHRVGLYARRVVGREKGCHDALVERRIQEMESGHYDRDWAKIERLEEEALEAFCRQESE